MPGTRLAASTLAQHCLQILPVRAACNSSPAAGMGGVCSDSTAHGSAAGMHFSLQESTNVPCSDTEKGPKPERNSALSKETTNSLGRVSQGHLIPYPPPAGSPLPALQEQQACRVLSRPPSNSSSLSDLPVPPCVLRKISYCLTWILFHDFLP